MKSQNSPKAQNHSRQAMWCHSRIVLCWKKITISLIVVSSYLSPFNDWLYYYNVIYIICSIYIYIYYMTIELLLSSLLVESQMVWWLMMNSLSYPWEYRYYIISLIMSLLVWYYITNYMSLMSLILSLLIPRFIVV